MVDPILGDLKPEVRTGGFFARQQSGSNANNNNNAKEEVGGKYERSLLKKVVLDRQSIWFSQPPQYPPQYTVENSSFPAPVQPAVYTGSLSSTPNSTSTSDSTSTSTSDLNLNADQTFLFKHLPEALLSSLPAAQAAKLGKTPSPAERRAYEEAVAMEAKMSEQTMRVLDLRNADAKGVRKESVRRIVEVFGGDLNALNDNNGGGLGEKADADGEPVATAPRMNTGHPTVTSAILTHRIHLLSTHLAANPRDVHNKKRLRELVHQRAKILSYYKKRVGKRGGEGEGAYLGLLDKLGLDRRGVEGELIVR